MRLWTALCTTILAAGWLLPSSFAVFVDEAYKLDYHHALLGIPHAHTTFFHAPQLESKAALIYTLTDRSLLGAINPKDGSIVWRQRLRSGDNGTVPFLLHGVDPSRIVSGVGSQVASWAASDGRLLWDLGENTPGLVKDLYLLDGLAVGNGGAGEDVLALFQGSAVALQRLDCQTGNVIWQYSDESGDKPLRIAVFGTNVLYISVHTGALSGLKIKVTTIDSDSGRKISQEVIKADNDLGRSADIIFIGSGPNSPTLVWTDKAQKNLKLKIHGNDKIFSFPVAERLEGEEITSVTVHAPDDRRALPHFLVQYNTVDAHWAEVYHMDLEKSTVSKAYDVPRLAGSGAIATSTIDQKVFFTRIAKGAFVVLSSASSNVVDRSLLQGFGVDGLRDHPDPILAVAEVNQRGTRFIVRAAVLLQSGDWTMILNGKSSWVRHESLSDITTAVFADLPRRQALALELEGHATVGAAYAHRVQRHLKSLQTLRTWATVQGTKVLKFLAGEQPLAMFGDEGFGFHKHVIVFTRNGRLIALDAANMGKMVWSIGLPESFANPDHPPTLVASPQGIVRVKGIEEHHVYDSLTGKFLRKANEFSSPADNVRRNKVGYRLAGNSVEGYANGVPGEPAWKFEPAAGERILTLTTKPELDPVASIGKVLGDRRVLYKYLTRNSVLVTSVCDSENTATFYLLDTVSGNLLYSTKHSHVDTSRPIPSTLSENWFAYSVSIYDSPAYPSRGYQLVVSELYESPLPNDRGPLGANSNFSSRSPATTKGSSLQPHVLSQALQIPEEISHLAVTNTRQGITSRMLLAILPLSGSVVGIPRAAFDARRPVGRDPTAIERDEGLFRYLPDLDFDAKWILSHERQVLGLRDVITTFAIVESSSLVFAYGGDVFGTRVSPSGSFDRLGPEFSKLQLVLTVCALGVGVLFVGPLVQRKQNNVRWQAGMS